MYDQSHAGELAGAAGKAAPPLAVSGAAIAGLSLQDWMYATTIAYTVLLIAHLIWKFCRDRRRG